MNAWLGESVAARHWNWGHIMSRSRIEPLVTAPDAAQAPVHIGVDLTPERAQAGLAVHVLHHRDGRLRALRQVFVVAQQALLARGRIEGHGAANRHGARIADDRRQLREGGDQALAREAGDKAPAQRNLQRVADGGVSNLRSWSNSDLWSIGRS